MTWNGATSRIPPAAETAELSIFRRILYGLLFGIYGLGAALWFAFLPRGFPVGHPRFWVNSALPITVVALTIRGLVALCRKRDALPRALVIGSFFLWLAAVLVGWIVFPVSLRRIAPMMCIGVIAQIRPAYVAWRDLKFSRRWLAGTSIPAVAVAVLVILSQRGGTPDTRPLDPPMSDVQGDGHRYGPTDRFRIGRSVLVRPYNEEVRSNCGGLELSIQPLLTFHSRSPDRCWTVFAPWRERVMPDRALLASDRKEGTSRFRYGGTFPAVLTARRDEGSGVVRLDASTRLEEPVFSHLNSFCTITVAGADRLFLSFSPCPGESIEVLPFDYPVGRPARLAYLDAGGGFNIVEASSGEKGPFRRLAGGSLRRDEPLTVTLHDGDRPACRITFEDWAAQAGTALSPTAGWGLPVNAIEFSRSEGHSSRNAYIFVTLAGTSVGRGWDSVGHAAGTYRNRMRIETLREAHRSNANTTTRDFTAEAAENAENGRKQGNGTKTTGELDSKAQRSSPFSAFSAVKK